MYTITLDDEILHDPSLGDVGRVVLNPKLDLSLNSSGSLSFTISPTHPLFNRIVKLSSVIRVFKGTELIFKGRVLTEDRDFQNKKDVYCEGVMSYLIDSIQRPYEYSGEVAPLFRAYISRHNELVEEKKRFVVGEVTVEDPNDYIHRESSGYETTLDSISTHLIDSQLGGFIRTREVNGVNYIDYLSEIGTRSGQVIRFGENLLDLSEHISAEEVYTVLIPLGAEVYDEETGEYLGRLGIETVNDGKDYLENETAVSLFGRIEKVAEWDDVTEPEHLKTKAQALLDTSLQTAITMQINAVDLSYVDVNADEISLGDIVRVVSEPHGIDADFQCTRISLDLLQPNQNEYEFGERLDSLTSRAVATENELKDGTAITNRINDAVNAATDAITGAKGGYVVINRDASGKPYEILVMDTPTVHTDYGHIWRWNQNGLGYSKNGYNGPYANAFYVDLTTGEGVLLADFIKAGVISDPLGNYSLDMDTGTVNMKNANILGGRISINTDSDIIDYISLHGPQSSALMASNGFKIENGPTAANPNVYSVFYGAGWWMYDETSQKYPFYLYFPTNSSNAYVVMQKSDGWYMWMDTDKIQYYNSDHLPQAAIYADQLDNMTLLATASSSSSFTNVGYASMGEYRAFVLMALRGSGKGVMASTFIPLQQALLCNSESVCSWVYSAQNGQYNGQCYFYQAGTIITFYMKKSSLADCDIVLYGLR